MSRNRIEDFGPYQDATRLFDLVEDMDILHKGARCYRLIGQQVGSADSICANMDEGFGRLSRKEFIRFLDISRGSARETLGRYKRMHHWLSAETIAVRVDLSDRIIARLTKTISTLRANTQARTTRKITPSNCVHEESVPYDTKTELNPDTITEEEISSLFPTKQHPTPHSLKPKAPPYDP